MRGPEKILYVAGVARSGTSWLGQIINSAPDVSFKFQPLFSYEFKNMINEDSNREQFMRFFESLHNSETEFLTQKQKVSSGEYPEFEKKEGLSVLAFKENRYQSVIEPVLRKCPEVRLISIIRNPCAVLYSWSQNPKEFPPGSVLRNEWRFANCKNKGNEDYFGYYKWKEVAHLYLDLKQKYPDRVCIMNYQHLVADTRTQSERLFDFCGLQLSAQTADFISRSTSTHNDSYYSVFKKMSGEEAWKQKLDPYIIEEIYADLRGTELEIFL